MHQSLVGKEMAGGSGGGGGGGSGSGSGGGGGGARAATKLEGDGGQEGAPTGV